MKLAGSFASRIPLPISYRNTYIGHFGTLWPILKSYEARETNLPLTRIKLSKRKHRQNIPLSKKLRSESYTKLLKSNSLSTSHPAQAWHRPEFPCKDSLRRGGGLGAGRRVGKGVSRERVWLQEGGEVDFLYHRESSFLNLPNHDWSFMTSQFVTSEKNIQNTKMYKVSQDQKSLSRKQPFFININLLSRIEFLTGCWSRNMMIRIFRFESQ